VHSLRAYKENDIVHASLKKEEKREMMEGT